MESNYLNQNQLTVVEHLQKCVLEERNYSIFFILDVFHTNVINGFGYYVVNDAFRKLSIKEQYEALKELTFSLLGSPQKKWIDMNKNQDFLHTYLTQTAIDMDKNPFLTISNLCKIISDELSPKKVVNTFHKLNEKEQWEVLNEFASFELAYNRIDWNAE